MYLIRVTLELPGDTWDMFLPEAGQPVEWDERKDVDLALQHLLSGEQTFDLLEPWTFESVKPTIKGAWICQVIELGPNPLHDEAFQSMDRVKR